MQPWVTILGVADLRYESSFVGFLKPRPKLTFGWVQGCHSYLDSATPYFDHQEEIDQEITMEWQQVQENMTNQAAKSPFYTHS